MGKQLIGACGLSCTECEGYKATQANDAVAVTRVAEAWSKQFGGDIKPEHVWCDGCTSDGPKKCAHTGECEIRSCATGKGYSTCAECSDFACDKLNGFFGTVPCAQERLTKLRG